MISDSHRNGGTRASVPYTSEFGIGVSSATTCVFPRVLFTKNTFVRTLKMFQMFSTAINRSEIGHSWYFIQYIGHFFIFPVIS